MSREIESFRENLQDILEFFGGKRLLTLADVKRYTGVSDYRTLKRRFPFVENYISAASLARSIAGGPGR